MLIALVTLLLIHFGSGHSPFLAQLDRVETAIKHDVKDEAHRKQALALVDQMKAVEKAHADEQKKTLDSLDKLLVHYDTAPITLEHSKSTMLREYKETRAKLLDLHFQLRSVLSASEWALVFPPPSAAPKKGA